MKKENREIIQMGEFACPVKMQCLDLMLKDFCRIQKKVKLDSK